VDSVERWTGTRTKRLTRFFQTNMEGCHGCGRPYDDSFADWTICRGCMWEQQKESGREVVYMDSLGISWTEEELKDAGGLQEVIKLNKEARVSN